MIKYLPLLMAVACATPPAEGTSPEGVPGAAFDNGPMDGAPPDGARPQDGGPQGGADVAGSPDRPADDAEAAPIPEKAQRAGEIAHAINEEPDQVDAILEENGTTRAEFEALLFEIARDPQLSDGYDRARSGK